MLLQSYVRAMLLVHGAVAFSYKNDARLDKHVLRSGREYSSQIEVSAASGQANNDLALMMGRQNNNDTATTRNQADSNAANDTAELDPRDRRPAELEASEIEFRTYLCWDDTEGCPAGLPECQDCGGLMLLWHRDVLNPSPRCSGVSFFHFLEDDMVDLVFLARR